MFTVAFAGEGGGYQVFKSSPSTTKIKKFKWKSVGKLLTYLVPEFNFWQRNECCSSAVKLSKVCQNSGYNLMFL